MRKWGLLTIIAFSLTSRLASSLLLGSSVTALPGIHDQISYHNLALRVVEGHGFTFATEWWPYTAAGQPTAHWSYLYTLFLAACYALFGPNPLIPRLIQTVASGVLMPLLAYRLGRRVAGERAGLWAAVAVALYGYFIYYAAALMTETFYIIGILWTLDCALRLPDYRPRDVQAGDASSFLLPSSSFLASLELGLAIGITVLLRQVFLLFVPFLLMWLLWVRPTRLSASPITRHSSLVTRHPSPRRPVTPLPHHPVTRHPSPVTPLPHHPVTRHPSLVTLLVLSLLILPATLYNYARFHRFVLLNTNAGFAFYWANHPIYGDRYQPLLDPEVTTYQQLIPEELRGLDEAALDSELLRRGLGFVAADPMRYLKLSVSRLPAYFEFWPSLQSGLFSNLARVFSFGVGLPLMLAGAMIWIRKQSGRGWRDVLRSPGALLLLFAVVYSGVHLLSWSSIRYRLPVDAVMLIFAGSALAALWGSALGLHRIKGAGTLASR